MAVSVPFTGGCALGLSDHQATRAAAGQTYYLSLLAEMYEKMGRTEEGLALVTEVLDTVCKNKECDCEAELYRLKGELILQQVQAPSSKSQAITPRSRKPNTSHRALSTQAEAEAEACFHKAIEIARRQQAKLWELRVTMSLARLWQSQGKKEEARQMLAEIYAWFTEGFDTKDLQKAKALLEEA